MIIALFDKFIKVSASGKRTQKNGKRIGKETIDAYKLVRNSLFKFSQKERFPLRIRPVLKLPKSEWIKEKKLWEKFYAAYNQYMLKHGYADNYIGFHFKNIKTFFSFIDKDLVPGLGKFHKDFYVRKEEIPVLVLLPEQLNFLISNMDFENRLSPKLKRTKDFFVFGCTVALRVSDLLKLTESNLIKTTKGWYLRVVSKKTQTETQVKLPDYSIDIINRNRTKGKYLLPRITLSNLNKNIKELIETAGWTEPMPKVRSKQGKPVEVKNDKGNSQLRFCDQVTSHAMRRTAITTMLILGVPEQVVRKISGHAATSREFYRYVNFSRAFQDQETDRMFAQLVNLK